MIKARMSKKYIYLREIEIKYKIKKVNRKKESGKKVNGPDIVYELFSDLQNETKEKLIVINLDAKSKIICFEVVAIGSLEAIHARPMEVFRTSVMVNAHAVVVVHNHPSGDPKPSGDDWAFTVRLKYLADNMGLVFHDHIVIGFGKYYSFAEHGLLYDYPKVGEREAKAFEEQKSSVDTKLGESQKRQFSPKELKGKKHFRRKT